VVALEHRAVVVRQVVQVHLVLVVHLEQVELGFQQLIMPDKEELFYLMVQQMRQQHLQTWFFLVVY
jgi:hypothetical protein